MPVFGRYAARNAAAGAVAFEALTGAALDEGVLDEGLAAPAHPRPARGGRARTRDRARRRAQPGGAEALAESACEEFFRWTGCTSCSPCSANKDVAGSCVRSPRFADVVHAHAEPNSVRSAEPEGSCAAGAASLTTVEVRPSVADAAGRGPRHGRTRATSCSSRGACSRWGRQAGARPRLRRFRLPPGPTSSNGVVTCQVVVIPAGIVARSPMPSSRRCRRELDPDPSLEHDQRPPAAGASRSWARARRRSAPSRPRWPSWTSSCIVDRGPRGRLPSPRSLRARRTCRA